MINNIISEIQAALAALSLPEKAAFFPKFFKTGKGEYGEGDVFLGVKVPDQRLVAKEYYSRISLDKLSELLSSKYHEHRLTALLMLILKFEKAKDYPIKGKIIEFYLNHLEYINNWDLVDTSCYKILGRYAFENQREDLLRKLSGSEVV
jgi:3-methyladenine DNA glycosylase AlkD